MSTLDDCDMAIERALRKHHCKDHTVRVSTPGFDAQGAGMSRWACSFCQPIIAGIIDAHYSSHDEAAKVVTS